MSLRQKIKSNKLVGPLAIKASAFYNYYIRILRHYRFYLKNKRNLDKNIELKNKYAGKRCFILGCGPSINTQDLTPLKDELCISVSNFFVHKDFKTISPEFHLFAESHTPITDKQLFDLFTGAEEKLSPDQNVFVGIRDNIFVRDNKLFSKNKIYNYTIPCSVNYKTITKIDFTKQLPPIMTVAHIALYLGIYLGCKEIYLLGCDHDTILHLGESRHFYKENESALTRGGYNEWHHTDWGAHFRAYSLLWAIYKRVKAYAEKENIKIVNSTPKSLLDIFPRRSLEEVLKAKK